MSITRKKLLSKIKSHFSKLVVKENINPRYEDKTMLGEERCLIEKFDSSFQV